MRSSLLTAQGDVAKMAASNAACLCIETVLLCIFTFLIRSHASCHAGSGVAAQAQCSGVE